MLRQVVAGALLLAWSTHLPTLAAAPLRCDHSALDPNFFRWRNDPELFLFGWGDVEQLEKLDPAARKPMELALSRVRSNGVTRTLDAARLAEALKFADGLSASAYGLELANFLGSGGPFDQPVELRIELPVLHAFNPEQFQAATKLAAALAPLIRGHNAPLVTFGSDVPSKTVFVFRDGLRAAGQPCLVGKDAALPFENDLGALDYVVFDPETFPASYRDQAAVGFAHSLAGNCPILIRVRRACFYPELFWLATGAAGIRYDFPVRSSEVHWRRSLCTLMKLAAYKPIQLLPLRLEDNVLACVEVYRSTMRLAIPSAQEILHWTAALPPEPVNIYRFWFDPANDMLVQQAPILKQHREITFRSNSPCRRYPHVFGFAFIPSCDDRQTTIGPITALWGEIPDEDEQTTK